MYVARLAMANIKCCNTSNVKQIHAASTTWTEKRLIKKIWKGVSKRAKKKEKKGR